MTMALLRPRPIRKDASGETAWTVLDAANDLGDTITVDACRRVIDANLRGEAPADIGHGGGRRILRLVPDPDAGSAQQAHSP